MHIVQKDGPVTPFTNTGWEKILNQCLNGKI